MATKELRLRLHAARLRLEHYRSELERKGAVKLSDRLDHALRQTTKVDLLLAPAQQLQTELVRLDSLIKVIEEPQRLSEIVAREQAVVKIITPIAKFHDIQNPEALVNLTDRARTLANFEFGTEHPPHPTMTYDMAPPSFAAPIVPQKECALIRVFYATNRDRGGSEKPNFFYANKRSNDNELKVGTVDVSIPLKGRKKGDIPRPKIWKFEFRENQNRHVMLHALQELPEEGFFTKLRDRASKLERKIGLIYIHGYNVTFAQAARRTAQLAFDLFPINDESEDNKLQVLPLLFSWPSSGRLLKYTHDSTASEASAGHLKRFLEKIAAQANLDEITVLAHSMGNRPLVNALEKIAMETNTGTGPILKNVLLAAPDVDRDVFLEAEAKLKKATSRITMYASKADYALHVSKLIFNGFIRLGDSSNGAIVFKSGDTIDATVVGEDIVGHSYYGNKSILTDIFGIMKHGFAPGDRFGLTPRTSPKGAYWEMT